MPTAGKLFAAIFFCLVGWAAAEAVLLTYPPDQPTGYFTVTIAGIGIWQGWFICGPRMGQGPRVGLGMGMRTSAQIAFFGILTFALVEMFERSTRLRYDAPFEAVIATFELFVEYFLRSLTVPVWGVLLIGGALAGLLADAAGRRWR